MTVIKSTAEPGSPEWHARRQRAFNASDIGAAMGCDPNKTRSQLLHELYTGIRQEFSDYVQKRVIEPGHRIEALARPIAEQIIGDDLQVIGAARDFGLSRPLGASMDGMDFLEAVGWECKRANDELRAALPHTGRDSAIKNNPAAIPKAKRAQTAQQQLVFGHSRTLFTVADFDRDGNVTEERHCWYDAEPELQREVIATWKQIDADLATYTPPAASAVEKIVAEPVEMLPATVVQVSGTLALQDNFAAFETRLRAFLADKLIREPKTDQDFADLDAQIKVMKDARDKLKQAEAQMLAQVQPIDQAKRTKDMLDKLLQQNVSMAEKILTDEKERRKGEIVAGAVTALREHVAGLNKRLGQPFMPATASAADFGGCIKGLRSLDSMEDKIATALANAKIAANEVADRIAVNLLALPGLVGARTGLTPDLAALVVKSAEDFAAVVSQRVTAQREQEERRAAELAERERERVRREEEARAAEKLRQEQEAAAAEQRRQREAEEAQRRADQAEKERLTSSEPEPRQIAVAYPPITSTPPLSTGPANVVPMPTKAPATATTPPSLKLGEIQRRIAPLSIDAAGLAVLGFPHVSTQGAAKLYHDQDYPRMLAAMLQHIGGLQQRMVA